MEQREKREGWHSGLGFILAAAGSAIGLGNIWRFPYITGQHGGGAFVLIYLLCVALIGLPVMLCEIALGRHTGRNPVGAFRRLNPDSCRLAHLFGAGMTLCGLLALFMRSWGWGGLFILIGVLIFKYRWTLVGVMGVVAGFVILSFYSVVAGWTIGYVFKAATGQLAFETVDVAKESFGAFITHPGWAILCHFLFMALCVAVVCRGIQGGIEKVSKVLMPLLFMILLALIVRGLTLPGAMAGVRYYLSPNFKLITPQCILVAVGLAFFSLSLGMGAMITYGSYVAKEQNLFKSAMAIVGLDVLVAFLAGLAIFPAVFALGFQPDQGSGLAFQALPAVFHHMPLGAAWAFLFFLLLLVAALTSGISLLEVVTAYWVDERRWSRRKATLVFGGCIFALGCLCAVSVANWNHIKPVEQALATLFGGVKDSFFVTMETMADWMLALGGLLIALFVGWVWGVRRAVDEIRQGSDNFADVHLWSVMAGLKDDPSHNSDMHVFTLASLWGVFVRFICPVAIVIAFLNTIGWLELKGPEAKPAAVEQVADEPVADESASAIRNESHESM